MAIKIPSKNIYEMNNPKIRDNVIDNVSVEQTVVENDNQFDVTIYEKKVKEFIDGDWSSETTTYLPSKIGNLITSGQYISERYYSIGRFEVQSPKITRVIKMEIKKLSKNKYISELKKEIGVSIEGKVETQTISQDYSGVVKGVTEEYITNLTYGNIELLKTREEKTTNYVLPKEINGDIGDEFQGSFLSGKLTVPKNYSGELEIIDEENEDYFTVKITNILCGMTTITISDTYGITQSSGGFSYVNGTMSGTRRIYTPQILNISFKGNLIGIDLTDGSITYGSGKKPHSLSGNELLQDSGKTNGIAISEHLANNVLVEYGKGKETATLLCDIADYYDESGEKVIDIKTEKMSFRLHDEVIPYVFGANGQDYPMSKHQDGSAKVFEVVGSNIIYDGAVWQELSLLEKTQNT